MKVKLLISLFSFLLLLVACSEQQSHTAPAVHDRDSASMMTSYGVNTLISDSGVIKYRIVTERWDVNTIKNPPRWTFEKGIFMEQFDQQFHIEASRSCGNCVVVSISAMSTALSSVVRNFSGMASSTSSILISSRVSLLQNAPWKALISVATST